MEELETIRADFFTTELDRSEAVYCGGARPARRMPLASGRPGGRAATCSAAVGGPCPPQAAA